MSPGMPSFQTDYSPVLQPSFGNENKEKYPSYPFDSKYHAVKYDFRPFTLSFSKHITTWVDQDESGDFDPECEQPCNLIPSINKRERPICRDNGPRETTYKKPKLHTWQLGRRVGLSCPVALKLESDRGRAFLQEIGVHLNNWPKLQLLGENAEMNFTELNSDAIQSQRLRNRQSFHQDDQSSAFQRTSRDNFSLFADVMLGHPAARGCKGCLEIGVSCTLLQEGSTYPCFACKDDGFECELVLPPAKKRACESCRRRRIVCSYRSTNEDHSSSCKQCENSRAKCVAGPLSGRTRTGPCLDQKVSEPSSIAQRPYVACTQCREAKKYCSLRYNRNGGTCKRCVGLEKICTFEAISDARRKEESKTIRDIHSPMDISSKTLTQNSSQTQTGDSLPTDLSPREEKPLMCKRSPPVSSPHTSTEKNVFSGTTRMIKTRLAHPVTFNHQVPEDGSTFCHWCNDYSYGLIGLGEVRVEVIDDNGGVGYIEIEGGHTAQGRDPSRMCHQCTTSRLFIACCQKHDIQPIESATPDIFDGIEVLEWLQPNLMSSAPFEWCSICVRPASFACKNPSAMGPSLMKDDLDEEAGCGLRLCEGCAVTLRFELDGRLDELINKLEGEGDCGPLDIRADTNFLHSNGHLMHRIYIR